jgi:hypothetical protein
MLAKETEGYYKQPWLQLHFRNQPSRFTAWRLFVSLEIPKDDRSPLFEITLVLVRLDHVARFIVNANHSIV